MDFQTTCCMHHRGHKGAQQVSICHVMQPVQERRHLPAAWQMKHTSSPTCSQFVLINDLA